jgi:hypothetical protein
MRLSLMLIHENLKSLESALKSPVLPGPYYKGIRILPQEPAPLDSDFLYVDLHNASSHYDGEVWTKISLASTQDPVVQAAENALIFPENVSITDIFNQLIDIFERFQNWESSIREALLEKQPLEDILNLCKMVTPELVYVTNLSMKMLAHSSPTIMNEISAIWQYQEKYGYMPMNIIKSLLDSGELDIINSYKDAFSFPTTTFNNPYTCRNIFCDHVMRAHIFIVSVYSKPLQTNKEIADVLGSLLIGYVKDNVDFFSATGLFHEHFFRDILNGKLTDSELIQQQLSAFGWNINDGYLLFVMEKENISEKTIRIFLHNLERGSYDCKTLELEQDLIVIFHVNGDNEKRNHYYKKIEELLNKLNCKGSISKRFSNLTDMNIYYRKAKTILSFCKTITASKNLYVEEEFGLYSFINAGLENHNAFEVCHPDIIALYEYDKQYSTDYLETLYQYLICDRNIVKAAKALFIHRNTMNYRMEKINSLIHYDEENPDVKSYILMSIYILKYVLKMQQPDTDKIYL